MSINMKIYRSIELAEHKVIQKESKTGEGKFSFNLKTRMIFFGTHHQCRLNGLLEENDTIVRQN